MKYVIYARKSTDSEDRQVQSIEDQLNELQKMAKLRDLNIVKTFTESQSAKNPGRPQYNEMMKMLRDNKADGILCWKLNRLARNPVDGGEIQWMLQQSVIKSIITINREYLPTDNVLMMAVELGMANQFVLDLSKDVKRGMQAKVEKGWRPGAAPLGYINDKIGDKGDKKIFKDPENFQLVRKMWDMLLTGIHTPSMIAKKASDEWGLRTRRGTKLSNNGMYNLFKNPFYYGYFLYNGEMYKGKHEPMISLDEFDKAQLILGHRGRPRPQKKRLPFTGIIQCGECGAMITADEKLKTIKKTGEQKRYIYHRCTKRKKNCKCSQKPIRTEDLEEQILNILDSITIHEDFLHWALEVLKDQNELEDQNRSHILINLHTQHEKSVKALSNLVKLFTSPENIDHDLLTIDEYKEQKALLAKNKSKLESEIRKNEENVDEWVELTEKTFNFATYAKHWFEEGDTEKKTEILNCLGQNFSLKDKKLSIELAKPYLVIKEGLEKEKALKTRLELKKVPIQGQFREIQELWSG